MKSIKFLIILSMYLTISCSDSKDNSMEDKSLEENIIGTWQVYNIEILDKNKVKLELPGYLSIECDARTKYKFLQDGEFIIQNSTTWREHYNEQGEIEGGQCDNDEEGNGFESGNWYIDFDENGEEVLDLNWIYKNSSTDGAIWTPKFLSDNAFLMSEYDEFSETYYVDYYKRLD